MVAATEMGVSPVEAVRWMLRKQLMNLDAMITLQQQLQAEASAWKQQHGGDLASWENRDNEAAYRACFERMDQPEWLGINGSLEERRTELQSVLSALDKGDYETVAEFLFQEYATARDELENDHSAHISLRLSESALVAMADEMVRLAIG